MWGWNQSLHGVVWNQPTTMFPTNIGMAATWNPALIQDVAAAIHDEARAINNLLLSTPGRIVEGQGRQCCLVTDDGRELRLTRTEFSILECLAKSAGRVVTRDRLLDVVWGDREVGGNNLEVFINFLRRKIDGPPNRRLIQTERGVGYCLRDEP